MGSIITLGIGNLEIDWGKNLHYKEHGALFCSGDIREFEDSYEDEDGNTVTETRKEVARKLRLMKRRLDLLGYSIGKLKGLYEQHLGYVPDYYPDVPLTYEEFYEVVSSLDVSKITPDDQWADHDHGEFLSRYLLKQPEFNKIHNLSEIIDKDIGQIFENLDPYITLRILADNPANLDLDVYWSYQDLVDGGWIEEEEITKNLGATDQILIVTEGSTDTNILKKAINLLYPDIADFFTFVDMKENYPFTGTGSLANFCRGLAKIEIKNNVLVIFDNDAAGNVTLMKLGDVTLPPNMHIMKLPEHDSFGEFDTIGPNGSSRDNINGSAVAIECFLDHTYLADAAPMVRWKSYEKSVDSYQGELVQKDKYTKDFLKLTPEDQSKYDMSKLMYLLDHIYLGWVTRSD